MNRSTTTATSAVRPIPVSPVGEAEFELDDASDENIPLVATELLPQQAVPMANPFDDVDYFSTPGPAAAPASMEIPTMSVEIPLPQGILESLPVLGQEPPATTKLAAAPERRANDGLVKEVILATNFTNEGEATAHYIGEMLRDRGLKVSRIARGVPVGGELEYVDLGTIAQALYERRPA